MSELIIEYDLSVQPATDRYTRIRDAAPEMYELLKSIDHALHLDLMNFDATDHRQVYDYAKNIRVLLAKIEGGGE